MAWQFPQMPDRLSPEQRSQVMARIKSKDTKPELAVRRMAHALGGRFRLHRRDLPGSPDIVFPKRRLALFVHGCFWHQHAGCARSKRPATQTAYWNSKLQRNVVRDAANLDALARLGWRTHVIWECEIGSNRLRGILADLLELPLEPVRKKEGS